MKVVKLNRLSKKDYKRIINRSFGQNQEIVSSVKKRMEDVKNCGDKILISKFKNRYGRKNYSSLLVSKEEINNAYKNVDKEYISAIKQMIKNITLVHRAQLKSRKDIIINPENGISVWREWRSIEKVGLYIPGGKAKYPSSVLMTAIPAKIAGCKEVIMCTPPREKGEIPSETLVAAGLVGINKIYKVGGVEAIAAMTYGTKTIPNVYKIFGAGNSYVTCAKMEALKKVAIDMPAGPSEIFIIADQTANPSFIASDLLADSEHGEDSACVLITTSREIAKETIREIKNQIEVLSTKERIEKSLEKYGLIGIVNSLDEAVNFANKYAPEHLEIMVTNPEDLVGKAKNAGSIFIGNWTAKATGDYATGANHVLPTGGMAKMYPPLSVESFGKWMQVQKCTKEGLLKIKKSIEIVANVEQLPAHRNSVAIRFKGEI